MSLYRINSTTGIRIPPQEHFSTGVNTTLSSHVADYTLSRTDSVSLRCDVSGDVTGGVNITWSKEGFSIDNDDRFDGNKTAGELVVENLDVEDVGQYECTAARDQLRVSSSIYIDVQGLLSLLFSSM